MIEHYYQQVDGWFNFQDVYDQAIKQASNGDTLVEIGCWKGQSLSYLLVEAANSGKKLNIVGIDHFRGDNNAPGQVRQAQQRSLEADCRCVCNRAQYPYRILPISSLDAATKFTDESLQFVFIDASHDYINVCNDIRAWLPKVRWGGVLAGHDYTGCWPAVAHAVHDFIPRNQLKTPQGGNWINHPDVPFSNSWLWQRAVPVHGEWIRTPSRDSKWLLYMGYVNRPDLLRRALASLGKHVAHTVVIDQSVAGDGATIHSGPLYRWQQDRHFTVMQNWIQSDSRSRELQCVLFMHSDAEVMPGAIDQLVQRARELFVPGPRHGVIFTKYDALCAFNPAALADVGCWDETFMWYVSDIDYYNRLLWWGWQHHDLPQAIRVHHGSQTLRSMDVEERAAINSNYEWALRHYYHKWGCGFNEGNTGRLWGYPYNGGPA